MEILLLIALFAGIFGGDSKKEKDKRRKRQAKERREREEYERKQREHLYWCETHGEL